MSKNISIQQEKALTPTPYTDLPPYRVDTVPAARMAAILRENFGGQSLRFTDLQTFGGTVGGKTTWTVDTGAGLKAVGEIRGRIVWHTIKPRAFYATAYDPANVTPPDCTSWDGVTGQGTPGGACMTCPMNQFGTAREGKGKGKACREKHLIFLLRDKDMLPCVISPPTIGLRRIQDFFLDLVNEHGCPYYEVETRWWMTESKVNGYDTALLHAEVTRLLTEEEITNMVAYRNAVVPMLERSGQE